MNDDETIALLAGINGQVLNHINAQKGEGHHRMPPQRQQPHYNITHPQNQNPQFQHVPPNGFNPNTNFPGSPQPPIPDPYAIPSEVSMTPSHYVPLLKDEHGNEIIPHEYKHLIPNNPNNAPTFNETLQTQGFNMPNYNVGQNQESEKFDLIIKELKSLKKAINKLIRVQENGKLSVPDTIPLNSTNIQ